MDLNESIIRYSCYLMRSDNKGLQFGWESKTKKYQYTTKLELKFLMRNMLTLSSSSSVEQKLPEFYLELIKKFTKLKEELRWDNNFELSQIANMDETLLFMNIPNTKTIDKIGSKEVNIKTYGQEKI